MVESAEQGMTFERGVFLTLLLLLVLLAVRTLTQWPDKITLEVARLDYCEPQRGLKPSAGKNYSAGRDVLVPIELTGSREEDFSKSKDVFPKSSRERRPRRPDNPITATNELPPKPSAHPVVAVKKAAPRAPKRKAPFSIKGLINYPGVGYRLLVVDEANKYSQLKEKDKFVVNKETLVIDKITSAGAMVRFADGYSLLVRNSQDLSEGMKLRDATRDKTNK